MGLPTLSVLPGYHRPHAGNGQRRGRIDAVDDAVGDLRTQDAADQRGAERQIGGGDLAVPLADEETLARAGVRRVSAVEALALCGGDFAVGRTGGM